MGERGRGEQLKITTNLPPPVVQPPASYTLELSGEELKMLRVFAAASHAALDDTAAAATSRFLHRTATFNLPYAPERCFNEQT